MSDEPFRWVARKIERALEHLNAIADQISEIVQSEDCGIVPDFTSEPGYLVIRAYMRCPPPPICSIQIGECLYQLRSALDHTICHLTEANQRIVDNKMEFPIFLRSEDFRDPATGDLKKAIVDRIGGLDSQQQALVEAEQPFTERYGAPRDDPLWWLYRLSNFDRHQSLHLVGAATLTGHEVFTPRWFADRFFTQVSSTYGTLDGETEVARFRIDPAAHDVSPPVAVQVKSHVTFGVGFDQTGPGAGVPVIPALKAIGQRVANVVAKFN